jgi:hypothetical protein
MKPTRKQLPRWPQLLLIFSLVLFWFTPAYSQEPIDIYMWVAHEMDIRFIPAIPKIQFVQKEDLQAAFIKANQNAYLRWETEFGQAQAQKFMNTYLNGVVGLFEPQTESIFVFDNLSACRKMAVLAHEITHFFQHIKDGAIDIDAYGADVLHMVRELEAYKIENHYMEIFCEQPEQVASDNPMRTE